MATGFLPRRGAVMGTQRQGGTHPFSYPAPAGGINAVDPLANLDTTYSVLANNLIPDGRGLRVRSGYQKFATNVGAGEVRTVIPFQGATAATDKLFVAGPAGIYDISAGGAGAWATSIAFGTTTGNAGYGVYTDYVLDNSSHYVFYADEVNGLYQYPSGGPWVSSVGLITGPAGGAASIAFIMQHKGRIWMIERDSARAWYLPTGAVAGAATRFDFGNKFKHGGTLVGLWNWTVDGGIGVDDHLVALSSSGDVIVYKGNDPSSAATWSVVGQYYIGAIPAGRRQAQSFGGELFLLSQYGLLPMSRLISGAPVQENDIYASAKISPLVSTEMAASRTSFGWEVRNIPSENVFVINTPKRTGLTYKQFAMSTKTNGWCIFNDLEYITGDVWQGTFYIGGAGGNVYRMTGNSDAVSLTGTGGNAVSFSLITAFSDLGDPGRFHRVQFLRPVFRASAAPSYSIAARYDYNTDDYTGIAIPVTITGALWDAAAALWDTALWGGDAATIQSVTAGSGIGRAVAAVLLGTSTGETNLIRIDLMADTGGML